MADDYVGSGEKIRLYFCRDIKRTGPARFGSSDDELSHPPRDAGSVERHSGLTDATPLIQVLTMRSGHEVYAHCGATRSNLGGFDAPK